MSGKKHGNFQIGGDKRTRDRVNQRNPRENKKGGKPRKQKKQSPIMKYLSVNKGLIGVNWKAIKL